MDFRQEKPYYCGPASLAIVERELGYSGRQSSQDSWANIARTSATKGTSCAGLKRALLLMGSFEIVRKTEEPWKGPAIVYDKSRDHWMVATVYDNEVTIKDPETGFTSNMHWSYFQSIYMDSKRHSYALVAKRDTWDPS